MELNTLTIKEASDGLREGKFRSRDIVEACLAAISQKDKEIHAYLEVFAEEARSAADEADKRFEAGAPKSALDGIPLALKDNMLLWGKRATAGSKILENYTASYDATVVDWLKKAGAVILGKTNLDEFAMGSSTEHSAFGPTKNPHELSRVPGGSSGGSAAAVASHMCLAALGSDTGGSIRQPASFCGIAGLKPTYGRVSRSGLIAMASSLDQIGPMTKTVEDAELLFAAIAGHDPRDATTHPESHFDISTFRNFDISGLRIGIPKEYFGEGLDEAIRNLVYERIQDLEKQGVKIQEISLPHTPAALAVYYLVMPSEVSANLARFDGIRYGASLLRRTDAEPFGKRTASAEQRGTVLRGSALGSRAERGSSALFSDFWGVYLETRKKYFGDEVRRRIMLGTYALSSGYYDAYYLQAQKMRARIREDFDRAFQEVDVIITPTSPGPPFRFGERTQDPLAMYLADIYTVSAPLAGIPGISLPAGLAQGLPAGVQLMGKPFSEALLFSVGRAIEQSVGI